MHIKATIVAYAFSVQCFENATIVAYAGLRVKLRSWSLSSCMFITVPHLGWYSGCIGCYTKARTTQWSCVQFSRNSARSRSHSGMHKIIVILSNCHGDMSSSVV